MILPTPINDSSQSWNKSQGPSAREWFGLAFLALPTILLGADLTLLHLAMPALAADLRPSSTEALWIMDSYGFMIAGFLVTMGTLGDRYGRRKLLMIGSGAFGLTSVFAAFSTSPIMLIVARAALGVAAATLMPSTLALISNMFVRPRERSLAIGIWATMFALGMAIGPLVGGVLLEHFWWGSAFLLAVPVVVTVLIGAPLVLPEYRDSKAPRLDAISVMLSLASLLPLIYGMKQAAKGDLSIMTLISAAAGVSFVILFVRRQGRLNDPLLDMELFSNASFAVALIILMVGWIAVAGIMFLVTQYLQIVIGLSPLHAGLWMGPPALAQVMAGIAAPLISRCMRPAYVAAIALLISVLGFALLVFVGSVGDALTLVVLGFSLAYVGLGAIAALGTDLVVCAVPADKAGSASAMSETVQDLGVSLGIAILGSLSTMVYRREMLIRLPADLPKEIRSAFADSLWSAAALGQSAPEPLLRVARDVFTTGFNIAALFCAVVIAFLAILAAIALRHIRPMSRHY